MDWIWYTIPVPLMYRFGPWWACFSWLLCLFIFGLGFRVFRVLFVNFSILLSGIGCIQEQFWFFIDRMESPLTFAVPKKMVRSSLITWIVPKLYIIFYLFLCLELSKSSVTNVSRHKKLDSDPNLSNFGFHSKLRFCGVKLKVWIQIWSIFLNIYPTL